MAIFGCTSSPSRQAFVKVEVSTETGNPRPFTNQSLSNLLRPTTVKSNSNIPVPSYADLFVLIVQAKAYQVTV